MVSGRKLIYFGRNFDGPLLYTTRLDTDSSSVNFCIFPSDLGLHESTVGVALGSHIAERKRVRAHGGRKSVFYSTHVSLRLNSPSLLASTKAIKTKAIKTLMLLKVWWTLTSWHKHLLTLALEQGTNVINFTASCAP